MELRRLMDKIDMMHHDNFEKLVAEHESEIGNGNLGNADLNELLLLDILFADRINNEHESKIKEVENACQNQVSSLRATLELVKEQMAKDSQQKIEDLIDQHRAELGNVFIKTKIIFIYLFL